jgi:hypothetical protein
LSAIFESRYGSTHLLRANRTAMERRATENMAEAAHTAAQSGSAKVDSG